MLAKRAARTDSSSAAWRARATPDQGEGGNLLGGAPRAGEVRTEQ